MVICWVAALDCVYKRFTISSNFGDWADKFGQKGGISSGFVALSANSFIVYREFAWFDGFDFMGGGDYKNAAHYAGTFAFSLATAVIVDSRDRIFGGGIDSIFARYSPNRSDDIKPLVLFNADCLSGIGDSRKMAGLGFLVKSVDCDR